MVMDPAGSSETLRFAEDVTEEAILTAVLYKHLHLKMGPFQFNFTLIFCLSVWNGFALCD